VAVHNFIEAPGWDGFDWDAYSSNATAFENVVIGAGRWAGFVEEGSQGDRIVRNLNLMADLPPVRSDRYTYHMGWCDNGTTQGIIDAAGPLTDNNYFVQNISIEASAYAGNGNGNYFANKNADKGWTWFWGNEELGTSHGTTGNYWYQAVWTDTVPTQGQQWIDSLQTLWGVAAWHPVDTTGSLPNDTLSTSAGNLLSNPGFESGVRTPWSQWGDTRIVRDTALCHGGKRCLVQAGIASNEQRVWLVGSATSYTLTAWVRSGGGGKEIRLGVKGIAGGEQFVGSSDTGWVELSLSFTVAAADTEVVVYLYSPSGGGEAFADGVALFAVAVVEVAGEVARRGSSEGLRGASLLELLTGWAKQCNHCAIALYDGQGRRLLSWREGVLPAESLSAGAYWAVWRIPVVGVCAASLTVE
jgi:hypothetical protein